MIKVHPVLARAETEDADRWIRSTSEVRTGQPFDPAAKKAQL
jgi:hypothetical protein